MHHTRFAGLTELDPGDQITVDGASFTEVNPSRTDALLRVGAVTHHHDGHAALAVPSFAPSAGIATASGQIPADTTLFIGYTLIDSYGGETTLATATQVTTPPLPNGPTHAPSAAFDSSGGGLAVGQYSYAATLNDSSGAESTLGPAAFLYRPAGYASGRAQLSGLAADLSGYWRSWNLYRTTDGSVYQLIAQQQTSDTFTDSGLNCIDSSRQPPTTMNDVAATNELLVYLPTAGQEPSVASAGQFNVYISDDGSFENPCFYASYPTASAGQLLTIPTLDIGEGAPPPVSLALPGANQINPDTDLLDWHWKRPVPTSAYLPMSGNASADVRVVKSPLSMWIWDDSSNTWQLVLDKSQASAQVASASNGHALSFADLTFVGSGAAVVGVSDLGNGSAKVTVTVPPFSNDVDPPLDIVGQSGSALVIGGIEFAGSGLASIQASQDPGTGSAKVTITVTPSGGTGSQGPAGANGTKWWVFTGTLPAGIASGDLALNQTTGEVYEYDGWVLDDLGFSLLGPIGPAGSAVSFPINAGIGGSALVQTGISITGSGATIVSVSQLGGSAYVNVYSPPQVSFKALDAQGGSALVGGATAIPIEFIHGNGSATVTTSGGSAIVTLTAPSQKVPVIAGSGGVNAVNPDYYTEYAGSGGVSIAMQNLGGGSARVLIGFTGSSITATDSAALHWKGPFGSSSVYAQNDVVTLNNSTYRANKGTGSVAPVMTGSASVQDDGTHSSKSITIPANCQVGDVILVAVAHFGPTTPTTPTGYTASMTAQNTQGTHSGYMVLYTKTAVAGDPGSTLTISGIPTNGPYGIELRTYTTAGIDSLASGGTGGTGITTLAPPQATATQDNELQVTFFGTQSSSSAAFTISLAAGGSDTFVSGINSGNFEADASEDFPINKNGSVSGGSFITTNQSPSIVGISVTLQPIGAGGWQPSQWDLVASAGVTPTVAASGGANSVAPSRYTEFAASGGVNVAVQNLGGGSARIIFGSPNTMTSSTAASGYVFSATDVGAVVESASASTGSTLGFIVPRNADRPLPLGAVIEVFQYGTDQIQIVGASANVALRSDGSKVKTAAQFATVGLRQRAIDEWVLSGDLA